LDKFHLPYGVLLPVMMACHCVGIRTIGGWM